jgi:hypothetical protein
LLTKAASAPLGADDQSNFDDQEGSQFRDDVDTEDQEVSAVQQNAPRSRQSSSDGGKEFLQEGVGQVVAHDPFPSKKIKMYRADTS